MHKLCAHIPKRDAATAWFLRALGIMFIITAVGFDPRVSFKDSVFVRTVQQIYPTWGKVLTDIVGTFVALTALALFVYGLIHVATAHQWGRRFIRAATRFDHALMRASVTFGAWIARRGIMLSLALVIWFIADALAWWLGYRLPEYASQPAIFVMAILGIMFILESFNLWANKINRLFCFHCRW